MGNKGIAEAVEKTDRRVAEVATITPPNLRVVEFKLTGTAPLVQLRFPEKAMNQMKAKHEAGSTGRKGVKREPRNFEDDYKNAPHVSTKGWYGVPAGAFRNALISACRVCGFKMTQAKLAVFVVADGFDKVDGVPLVKIVGEPHQVTHAVRNATGVVDLRTRAMWDEWSMLVKVRFDADMFTTQDVANLFARAGMQVGIGEGRPDSKESGGMGWGTFTVLEHKLDEKSN
jgi:hypothetical protein